jgi:hypothetical protein
MTTEFEQKPSEDTPTTGSDIRLGAFEKRLDEWSTYLKDEASVRSPEILTAMAAKVHSLGRYLERMADHARVRREVQETYSATDPEADPHGDRSDQGTQPGS